jgi:hypothetical protein
MDSVTNLGLLVQLVALLVCWRAATAGWGLPAGVNKAVRRFFRRVGRRRWLAVGLVSAVALVNCVGLTALFGIPPPSVHDEFSYLLAADTFAHGRWANPPHPLWTHFESFHIIQQPTYASKYPPAQGLLLALGQLVAGHPVVGVWLSMALACGAVCWMLQAWVPPRWAFFGGLLLTLHPSILLLWGHSYWGGAPALLGGALVYGSLRRLLRNPRPTSALLFGLGLGILANSRPYEGLATSLPALAVLAV